MIDGLLTKYKEIMASGSGELDEYFDEVDDWCEEKGLTPDQIPFPEYEYEVMLRWRRDNG